MTTYRAIAMLTNPAGDKRTILLFGLITAAMAAVTASLALGLLGYADGRTGPCQFSEPVHSFGGVGTNQKLEHRFVFSNVGDHPISIKSLKADCGCLAYASDKKTFAPGDTGTIHVQLDTKGARPGSRISKRLMVEYTTGNKPHIALVRVEALVKADLSIEDGALTLRRSSQQDDFKGTLTVFRNVLSQSDFDSLKVHCPLSFSSLEIELDQAAKSGIESITLHYQRNGTLQETVIPIRLIGGEPLAALRPNCYVASLSTDLTPRDVERLSHRTIQIRSLSGEPISVASVSLRGEKTCEYLRWTVNPTEKNEISLWLQSVPKITGFLQEELEVIVRMNDGRTLETLILPCHISVAPIEKPTSNSRAV